jgi:hypothetical protein
MLCEFLVSVCPEEYSHIKLNPLLFELHQPTRLHFACRGCVVV